MEGGFANLPEDIKLEILARVPLHSIPACRRVCSDWRRITYDSDFVTTHSHRTRSISGCFVQYIDRNRYVKPQFIAHPSSLHPTVPLSLNFLAVPVKIEAVSDHHGIVLCTGYKFGFPLYVCKPATRQWKSIPIPCPSLQTVRTAIVIRPMGYKIVRIFRAEDTREYLHCQVFDSRSPLWRDSKGPGLLPNFFERLSRSPWNNKHGVLVCGALHWLTADDGIFAFDVQAEEWRLIPLPENGGQQGECKYKRIAGCQGKLWLLDFRTLIEKNERKAWMQVWTMTNYSNERWESRGVVKAFQSCENIKYLYTSDVAVVRGLFELVWFDLKKGKRNSVQLATTPEEIYMFETDTEPWELDSREECKGRKFDCGKRKIMTDSLIVTDWAGKRKRQPRNHARD